MAAPSLAPDAAHAPALAAALAAYEADAAPEAARLFTDLAAAYLTGTRDGAGPVSSARTPGELAARFDEPLPRDGRPLAEVVARLARDVVADANRLAHPMYVGHQVSAPLPAAIWTEALIGALNQSLAVAEMSPTATAVEGRVVRWMADLAGLGARAGGTLTSGGTEATFAALLAARSRAIPDVWTHGVGSEPPVIVCGEHTHYAVTRAAGAMGIGLAHVVSVASRAAHDGAHGEAHGGAHDTRMDPAALARTLADLAASGRRVMAVVATAGSTATGAFDDLEAAADACAAHDAWLHVDGAHGASALLSATHRHRVRGLARAHSLAWDPHKMLLLPLSAGVVLVRDERWLEGAFAQAAPYLFHAPDGADADDDARVPDQGIRSFQCSRRADALKLWVAFQRHGADGLGALYAHLCDTTARLHARLVAHPRFASLHAPESNILCFRWTGEPGAADARDAASLDALQPRLRARYNASGVGWITATTLGGQRVLRVTIMNPRTDEAALDRLVDGVDAAGRALAGGAAPR
jgi:L-2,4-diaminobutyrate decarboxylase